MKVCSGSYKCVQVFRCAPVIRCTQKILFRWSFASVQTKENLLFYSEYHKNFSSRVMKTIKFSLVQILMFSVHSMTIFMDSQQKSKYLAFNIHHLLGQGIFRQEELYQSNSLPVQTS